MSLSPAPKRPTVKRIGRYYFEEDPGPAGPVVVLNPSPTSWRLISFERRARRDLMREYGITTGRQWRKLRRAIRRGEVR